MAGGDEPLDDGAVDRRSNHAAEVFDRLVLFDVGDGVVVDAERAKLLHRGFAIRFGVDGVGLCLLEVAARDRVVLEQLFVERRRFACAFFAVASAFRSALTAAAKSGDATSASASPRLTRLPMFARMRATGPEIGESTCVDLFWLKATVPVAAIVFRNDCGVTTSVRTLRIALGCVEVVSVFSAVRFLAADGREDEQYGRAGVEDFHGCCSPAGGGGRGAPTASSSAASASFAAPRASTYWLSCREQRSFRIEKVERGRAAQPVADRCDAKDLAGLRKKMVADENRLSQ